MKEKEAIREGIKRLLDAQHLAPAKELLADYQQLFPTEPEGFSMQAVLSLMQGDLAAAEEAISKGLELAPRQPDLLFNKAYCAECREQWVEAAEIYEGLSSLVEPENRNALAEAQCRVACALMQGLKKEAKLKLAVFVKAGMDSFLKEILVSWRERYEVQLCQPQQETEIDGWMEWADVCWFEWCDELLIYGSRQPLAAQRKIICRLHSYEAFSDYPSQVKWDSVDCTVFVAEHIRDFVVEHFALARSKTRVIPNGIELETYRFSERRPGFNVAYVGYINYKKGPMLLLHAFKALHDADSRYKLYIAGQFQDHRDVLYFQQMTREWKLESSVIFTGWQDNLDEWLEDKNYILCTSILESQNISVMQAMAKGIKPIVHRFVGAATVYPEAYLWNTTADAVKMIRSKSYASKEYRKYIEEKYSQQQCMQQLLDAVEELNRDGKALDSLPEPELPLVTVGITVFNGKKYLKQSVESVLAQSYPNIEILLLDNGSIDGSRELIREYEKAHSQVKAVFHKENSGGPIRGINEIAELGRGDFVQWLCCDDCLEPSAIEQAVYYMQANPMVDYVYSDLNIIDEQGRQTGQWTYTVQEPQAVVRHIFHTGSGVIPMFGLMRKEFLLKNDLRWEMPQNDFNDFSGDTLAQLHFIRYGWNYAKLEEAVHNYRIHETNDSHNLNKRIPASVLLYEYIVKYFDPAVYLNQVNWDEIAAPKQYLNVCVAELYLALTQGYASKTAIPDHLKVLADEASLYRYCSVYMRQAQQYLQAAKTQGSVYKERILQLQCVYDEIQAKMKSLGINEMSEI